MHNSVRPNCIRRLLIITPVITILIRLQIGFTCAQSFSAEQIQQGYHHQKDTTYFLFEEEWYQKEAPEVVVVTGSFRGWSQDMKNTQWQLERKRKRLWTIAIYNPNFDAIPLRAEFKFRINEGEWLQPPSGSPNSTGNNLIFMHHHTPPTLKAEIKRAQTLWVYLEGFERPLSASAYRLTDAAGGEIPIASVLPNTENELLITPAEPLDIRRVYYLEIPKYNLKSWCSFDGWFREIYSDKELGANISADGTETVFRIFSPRADQVKLYLYEGKDDEQAYKQIDMLRDEEGVWEALEKGNLKGVWYDFTVHGPIDPGNHFFETTAVHISDPYCRVSDDSWGKCRVWPATTPATPLEEGRPPMQDVIAYEVHVQDFTDQLPVSDDLKGTLPAFYQSGLTNKKVILLALII